MKDEIPDSLINRYDAIAIFHVLEHITEVYVFLEKVKDLLKKGGYLFIEVPDINGYLMDIIEPYNLFMWQVAHVSYFSEDILKKLIKNIKLEIVEVYSVQRYSFLNMANWVINGKPQIESPSMQVNAELAWLDKIYRNKICNDFKAGDTLFLIARNY